VLSSGVDEQVKLVVTDLMGGVVETLTTATNTTTPVRLHCAAGVYVLSASTANGRYVARVVVE
jgi:hypothetical protein